MRGKYCATSFSGSQGEGAAAIHVVKPWHFNHAVGQQENRLLELP